MRVPFNPATDKNVPGSGENKCRTKRRHVDRILPLVSKVMLKVMLLIEIASAKIPKEIS